MDIVVAPMNSPPHNPENSMSTFDPQGTATGSGAQIVGSGMGDGPGPDVMAASTLRGTTVISSDGGDVGNISDIMLAQAFTLFRGMR